MLPVTHADLLVILAFTGRREDSGLTPRVWLAVID
jgi:hypothetical protein